MGKIPVLTKIFQMGWNHQPGRYVPEKTQATLRLTRFLIDWHSIWEIHLWSPLFDKEHNILPFLVSFQPQQTFTFPIPKKNLNLFPPPPPPPKKKKTKKQHNTTQQGKNQHNSTRKTTTHSHITQQKLLQIYQVGMNLSTHSPPSSYPLLRRRSITPGRAPWYVRPIGWWSPSCNRSSVPMGETLMDCRGVSYQTKNTHRYFLLGPKFCVCFFWK